MRSQIDDLFHAKQRLWEVAKNLYDAGSDLAEQNYSRIDAIV